MNSRELKRLLQQLLIEYVDPLLLSSSFTRRQGSINYGDGTADVQHSLRFTVRAPRYSDDTAVAHISAVAALSLPMITASLKLLLGDNLEGFTGNDPDTIAMNIGLLGPKHSHESWRLNSVDETSELGPRLSEYLKAHVLPFFNDYSTPLSVLHGVNDQRFPGGDAFTLQIAAVALDAGHLDVCKQLIEDRFAPKKGLARKYRAALEFVSQLSE